MATHDETIDVYVNLITDRLKSVLENPKQAWLNTSRQFGVPSDITGKSFNGINTLMLNLYTDKKQFELPVYLTYGQIKKENLTIKDYEKPFPIVYSDYIIKEKDTGENIPMELYNRMNEKDQSNYIVFSYQRSYNVFNIEQTNISQDRLDQLKDLPSNNKNNPYAKLDTLLEKQLWITPIILQESSKNIGKKENYESIEIPYKEKFQTPESFYSEVLYQMARSSGHENHLNRSSSFVLNKEELIAELTAAIAGQTIGLSTIIREENKRHINKWIDNLQNDKAYTMSVLSDFNKASFLVNTALENIIVKQVDLENKLENLTQKEIDNLFFMQQTGSFRKEAELIIAGVDFSKDKEELNYTLQNFKVGLLENGSYIYDIQASIRLKAGMILEDHKFIEKGSTKKALIDEGYSGKFIYSIEDTQKAINTLASSLRDKLQDPTLKIIKLDTNSQDFDAYVYNNRMDYIGKISAVYDMKTLNSWKLFTDTSNAFFAKKDEIEFVGKNMYGAAINDNRVIWRSIAADPVNIQYGSRLNDNQKEKINQLTNTYSRYISKFTKSPTEISELVRSKLILEKLISINLRKDKNIDGLHAYDSLKQETEGIGRIVGQYYTIKNKLEENFPKNSENESLGQKFNNLFSSKHIIQEKPKLPDYSQYEELLRWKVKENAANDFEKLKTKAASKFNFGKIATDSISFYESVLKGYSEINQIKVLFNNELTKLNNQIGNERQLIASDNFTLRNNLIQVEKDLKSLLKEAFSLKNTDFTLSKNNTIVPNLGLSDGNQQLIKYANTFKNTTSLEIQQELIEVKHSIINNELNNRFSDSWNAKENLDWLKVSNNISVYTLASDEFKQLFLEDSWKDSQYLTSLVDRRILKTLSESSDPLAELFEIFGDINDKAMDFAKRNNITDSFDKLVSTFSDISFPLDFKQKYIEQNPTGSLVDANRAYQEAEYDFYNLEKKFSHHAQLAYSGLNSRSINDIRIFYVGEEKLAITANIWGKEQMAVNLNSEDYKAYMDKVITKEELIDKYFSDAIENNTDISKGIKL